MAAARYLRTLPGVDAKGIGMWGGSYGGYLTALALARNSDLIAAGVDIHGVHDWSRLMVEWIGKPESRYEKGDREEAMKVAWTSSPVSSIEGWTSPVLLMQGDDDRNVPFQQTVDLARAGWRNCIGPTRSSCCPMRLTTSCCMRPGCGSTRLRRASWLAACRRHHRRIETRGPRAPSMAHLAD